MEWNLNDTSVVILGAGFSAAATEGRMPLMTGFFDKLTSTSHPFLYQFVSAVAGEVSTANVESVLLALDQIKTAPEVALEGWAENWKAEVPKLRRELSEYTISRLSKALELVDDDNWAINLLADAGPKTTVISMNYDNIADAVLSNRNDIEHGEGGTCPHCKMRFLLEKACSCTGKDTQLTRRDWEGALIKPHGSIAWKRCLNPVCCSYECLVADAQCQPFAPCECPNCQENCGPVIVMPTMSKCLDEIQEIGIMWKAARLAICEAESILLFGFSMPASDELLMQMIRSSIHANGRLRRIASIDLNPSSVLERFSRCVPTKLSSDSIELPVTLGKPPSWVHDLALPVMGSRFVSH